MEHERFIESLPPALGLDPGYDLKKTQAEVSGGEAVTLLHFPSPIDMKDLQLDHARIFEHRGHQFLMFIHEVDEDDSDTQVKFELVFRLMHNDGFSMQMAIGFDDGEEKNSLQKAREALNNPKNIETADMILDIVDGLLSDE